MQLTCLLCTPPSEFTNTFNEYWASSCQPVTEAIALRGALTGCGTLRKATLGARACAGPSRGEAGLVASSSAAWGDWKLEGGTAPGENR